MVGIGGGEEGEGEWGSPPTTFGQLYLCNA